MMNKYDIYPFKEVIPLEDSDFESFLNYAISNASLRIWICMFLINCYPNDDEDLKVRSLLNHLGAKQRENIDVRIISEMAKNNVSIHNSNKLSYMYGKYHGIKFNFYNGSKYSMHSKYIIIDQDLCILGSHNFTHGAFSQHKESSIAIYSEDINKRLSSHFYREWKNSNILEKKEIKVVNT